MSGNGVPNSSDVVKMYKAVIDDITAINDIFVSSKINSKTVKQIVKFNKEDLKPAIDSIVNINNGIIDIVRNIKMANDYILKHKTDYRGIEYLSNILREINKFVTLKDIKSGNSIKINTKNFNDLFDRLMDVMADLRFLSFSATASARIITPGLDDLMGDSGSYSQLMSEPLSNKNPRAYNNNSILFRYMLLNKIMSTSMNELIGKMSWWKRWRHTVHVKKSIKYIFNILTYFSEQAKKLKKSTARLPESIGYSISNVSNSLSEFLIFYNMVGQRNWGLKARIEARRNIRRMFKVIRFFFKQFRNRILPIIKEIPVYNKKLEFIREFIKSVQEVIVMFDMSKKLKFFTILFSLMKIKESYKALLSIIKTANRVNRKSVENALEISEMYVDFFKNTVIVFELINTSNIKERKIKKIIKLINSISTLINYINIKIKKKKIDDSIIVFKSVNKLLDLLILASKKAMYIGVLGILGFSVGVLALFVIVLFVNTLKLIKVKKSTITNVDNLILIINKIIEPIMKFSVIMTLAASLSVLVLLGVAVITTSVTTFIFAFFGLGVFLNEKRQKDIERLLDTLDKITKGLVAYKVIMTLAGGLGMMILLGTAIIITSITAFIFSYIFLARKINIPENKRAIRQSQKEILKISAVILEFSKILEKAVKIAVLASAAILILSLSIFIFGYLGVAKILQKRKITVNQSTIILTKICTSLALFAQSMQKLTKGVDPKMFVGVLMLGGVILEIILILYLVQVVSKPAKGAIKMLLFISLGLALFFGTMALISLLTITFSASILFAMLLLGGIVAIFFFIGKNGKPMYKGAIALLVISGVLALFSFVLFYFADSVKSIIDDNLWLCGLLFIGGLIGIFVLAGLLLEPIALGSAAIGLIAIALILLVTPLMMFTESMKILSEIKFEEGFFKNLMNNFADGIGVIINSDSLTISSLIEASIKLRKLSIIACELGVMGLILQKLSSLKIPLKYGPDGNPIEWATMKKEDFINASINATTIASIFVAMFDKEYASTLGIPGIKTIDLDALNNVKNKVKRKFRQLRKIVESIGSMSVVLQSIASLKIPKSYDKNGNGKDWVNMTNKDFIKASINATTIASIFVAMFDEQYASTLGIPGIKTIDLDVLNNIKSEICSKFIELNRIVTSIGNMATVLQNISSLRIPMEFDPQGKANKWATMQPSDFENAGKNITTIITYIFDIFDSESVKNIIENGSRRIAKRIRAYFEAISPVTDMINTVINMASGIFAIKFDKTTGKPTEYGNINELLSSSTNIEKNIEKAINAFINGSSAALKNIDEDKLEELADKINIIKDIGSPLNSIIESTVKVSTNFESIDNIDATKLQGNITNIIKGVLNPVADESIFKTSDIKTINEKFESLDKASGVIVKLVEADCGGEDNKNSVGNIKKATDATNNFLTKLQTVDTTKLDKMTKISDNMRQFAQSINGNFEGLAKALSKELVEVLDKLDKTLQEANGKLDNVQKSFSSPTPSISSSIQSKGDGKPKKEDPGIKQSLAEIGRLLSNGELIINKITNTVSTREKTL